MFTIGADPELFLKDNDGKLISVVGKIGGSKSNPFPIGEGCAIQEDNVAAEFCIPAASDVDSFVGSILYALSDIEGRAKNLGLTLANYKASHSFDPDQLDTPQAQEFGCDPDYNAYTREVNPRPKTKDKNLRSAGGHVHVGTKQNPFQVIQCLDVFLGLPSVLLDSDTERRKLYGKAGCFRFKPYGVEYRTLSNFWIWDKSTIGWVYHNTQQALDFCENNSEFSDEQQYRIQNAINKNDKSMATHLINSYGVSMP